MSLEKELFDFLEKHKIKYIQINDSKIMVNIHHLFLYNIVDDANLTPLEAYYLGCYYEHIKTNYSLMRKYYDFVIANNNNNNDNSDESEDDIIIETPKNELALQNQNIFIENHLRQTMSQFDGKLLKAEAQFRLGKYWRPLKTQGTLENRNAHFKKATEYYYSAFKNGHLLASEELCDMCEELCDSNNFKCFLKYATDNGCLYATQKLASYYGLDEKKFHKMVTLYSIAIDGNTKAIDNICNFCDFYDFSNDADFKFYGLNDTVLIIILKYKHLFTRKQIVTFFKAVFSQSRIENQETYGCLKNYEFTDEDENCDSLIILQNNLKHSALQQINLNQKNLVIKKRKSDNVIDEINNINDYSNKKQKYNK